MSGYLREELGEAFGERLRFYPELGSTNDEALRLARQGCPAGTVILAERQTAGRGRRGSDWFSGEGAGIAVSLILRPTMPRPLWSRLSLVAGLAVAKVLERRHLIAEIKWPNDVLVTGKKVCGILVEAEGDAVVIGVGLNVGAMALPETLTASATSLSAVSGEDFSREDILAALIAEMVRLSQRAGTEFGEMLALIRERCWLAGKTISYQVGGKCHTGLCRGIDDGGELLVESGGVTQRLIAAEVIRVVS